MRCLFLFWFILVLHSENVVLKTLCKEDHRELHVQKHIDPSSIPRLLWSYFSKLTSMWRNPVKSMQRQSLMNIMHMLSVSILVFFYQFLLPWKEQRCRASGAFTLWCLALQREKSLFPGSKNNWYVYTINGRKQAGFSGEIWTQQHYHLLLPLKCTVQNRKNSKTGFRWCSSCCFDDVVLIR